MISQDIKSLRGLLVGASDRSPNLEIHMTRENSVYACELLYDIERRVQALEEQSVPLHMRNEEISCCEGEVVSLSAHRAKRAKGSQGGNAA